jgi:hypothetical protein
MSPSNTSTISITANVPEVAIRFRHSVTQTAQSLSHHPLVGQRVSSDISGYQNLRSYPISGFEFIRFGTAQREISDGEYDLGISWIRRCRLAFNLRFC